MPKAYIVARIDVTDPERYGQYTARSPGIAAEFGGRFIARGGRHDPREGQGRSRNVIIEFPDYASAQAFYDSEAYQAILPHARAGSERELVIVEGAEEPA